MELGQGSALTTRQRAVGPLETQYIQPFLVKQALKQLVGQDVGRLVAKCFVACPADAVSIAAYYTLAAVEVPPDEMARKLPRYPTVPVVRMGRPAVDLTHRGKGLGAALVANAVSRTLKSDIAAVALMVDAKDDSAAAFYQKVGFFSLGSDRVLALPLATVQKKDR